MSTWPTTGDSLLNSGIDWQAEALLGTDSDWIVSYALSFKNGANAIVERVEARNVSPDSVAYAILYLYRHYLELMLKGLIAIGRSLESRQSDFPQHHKLKDLWTMCRPFIEAACPDGETADLQAVQKCILEFHDIDPTGETFRFGEQRKDGKCTLPENLQLSLTNVRDVTNRIAGFLEASYDWMNELLQHQADVDAEAI